MVDSTALFVVRVFAGLGALGLIWSPSILMYRIHKQQNVGVASVLPLVMLLANSHMWTVYGYLGELWFPVFSCFLVGDVAALLYIAVYWRYTTERRYVTRMLLAVLSFLSLVTIYAVVGGLGYTNQTRSQVGSIVGYIGDVTAILLYAAPMEKMVQVLKHKSAAFINVHMVIASLTNNWMWFSYGILADNWIILAPNILFVALNSFTLVLYLVFNPKTHPLPESFSADRNDDDERIQVTVEMSPKAASKAMPSPEYSAMQSPLEPLRLQLDRN